MEKPFRHTWKVFSSYLSKKCFLCPTPIKYKYLHTAYLFKTLGKVESTTVIFENSKAKTMIFVLLLGSLVHYKTSISFQASLESTTVIFKNGKKQWFFVKLLCLNSERNAMNYIKIAFLLWYFIAKLIGYINKCYRKYYN